ncbi:putative signal peptide protein [Puccinia sorghi]|uniref:Putative signal peptide protein n=1 Tax=Puccinia sorghi TaxID=27349 RepID=A0A0L6V9B8_9BASI|nr:putative signal peptide protein [Puccinia sorghi]
MCFDPLLSLRLIFELVHSFLYTSSSHLPSKIEVSYLQHRSKLSCPSSSKHLLVRFIQLNPPLVRWVGRMKIGLFIIEAFWTGLLSLRLTKGVELLPQIQQLVAGLHLDCNSWTSLVDESRLRKNYGMMKVPRKIWIFSADCRVSSKGKNVDYASCAECAGENSDIIKSQFYFYDDSVFQFLLQKKCSALTAFILTDQSDQEKKISFKNSQSILGISTTNRQVNCKKKIAQLPPVDMQHAPAKLPYKLHMFAYLDVLAHSVFIVTVHQSLVESLLENGWSGFFFSKCLKSSLRHQVLTPQASRPPKTIPIASLKFVPLMSNSPFSFFLTIPCFLIRILTYFFSTILVVFNLYIFDLWLCLVLFLVQLSIFFSIVEFLSPLLALFLGWKNNYQKFVDACKWGMTLCVPTLVVAWTNISSSYYSIYIAKKLAQLPVVKMKKVPGSFRFHSNHAPKVIQRSFDAQSLLAGACCMSTACIGSCLQRNCIHSLKNYWPLILRHRYLNLCNLKVPADKRSWISPEKVRIKGVPDIFVVGFISGEYLNVQHSSNLSSLRSQSVSNSNCGSLPNLTHQFCHGTYTPEYPKVCIIVFYLL